MDGTCRLALLVDLKYSQIVSKLGEPHINSGDGFLDSVCNWLILSNDETAFFSIYDHKSSDRYNNGDQLQISKLHSDPELAAQLQSKIDSKNNAPGKTRAQEIGVDNLTHWSIGASCFDSKKRNAALELVTSIFGEAHIEK